MAATNLNLELNLLPNELPNYLRIALGHTDLSTTQSYIMTTKDEIVAAMREW
jgi:hypothetical protein